MNCKGLFLKFLVCSLVCSGSSGDESPVNDEDQESLLQVRQNQYADEKPHREETRVPNRTIAPSIAGIATDAYVYGFALTEWYRARQEFVLGDPPGRINKLLRKSTADIDCNFTKVVTPNVDTAYTNAHLDVTQEP